MSGSAFNRIETILGLFSGENLTLSARLGRLFRALWLRPFPIPPTPANLRDGFIKRLLVMLLSVSWLALKDVAHPFLLALRGLFAPLRWLSSRFHKAMDALTANQSIGERFVRIAHYLQGHRWLVWLSWGIAISLFLFVAQASLPLIGQWLFVLVCYIFGQFFRRLPSRLAHLALMIITLLLLARYVFWRLTSTLDLLPGIETFLGYTLLIAESYTWLVLIIGFVQTAWPLKRKPMPLALSPENWPMVDIFIPTYNEPISVVKPTVYAAKGIDWPADKITVYLLDDGHRPDFEAFAEQAGIEYISRPSNEHAKAGNINYALKQTQGEFIAIFDCDHLPTRSFLQSTMGWMLQNEKTALVQTPHHFFSADPFERNYDVFREVPNEGELFYGLIQDSNDYWNASFFCGSCAVIRRKPLEEVGGIAIETVTEDAHTSLKMHSLGYDSVYINTPLAAGLATESLSGHIGQRIRWARGMAQIFRLDNPMLKKGLSFFQRICYANAMLHFFYGIPRLIFLTMPIAFLFFEYHLFNAAAITIMSYALPQIMFASYTNSIIQGKFRKSFWSEIYETVLCWYIVLPTTVAFINPKFGKFNVTAKGGLIEDTYFDSNIARPYLLLMLINLFAIILGFFRLLIWNDHEAGTVLMNLLWAFFNMTLLGAAVAVATEAPQRNVHHRVKMRIPSMIRLPGGYTVSCYTIEYAANAISLMVNDTSALRQASHVLVSLNRGDREFLFPATLQITGENTVEAQFRDLTSEQEAQLIQCTFGRADAWLDWREEAIRDSALGGFIDVLIRGVVGYKRLYLWVTDGIYGVFSRLVVRRRPKTEFD